MDRRGERRLLEEGAAQEAPTAPHATPRQRKGKPTGPERFWARRPVQVVFWLSMVVSSVAHCCVMPLDMPPSFQINDVEGEATIPIDVVEQQEAPAPVAPTAAAENASQQQDLAKAREAAAAAAKRADAGPRDAAFHDSAPSSWGPRDGGSDAAADAPSDAPVDGREGLDGAIASADAGPSLHGPAGPEEVLGAAGRIQASPPDVVVIINAEAIKTNPEGAKLGYLLRGIPQWDEFMNGTDIDPIRDTDWVLISGRSLVDTTRDIVYIHYSAPDAVVDKAVQIVGKKYDRGGPIDLGVPRVRATLAHADRAERVLLRPQPHVLAVVPRSVAQDVARQLALHPLRVKLAKGEALFLKLVNPHRFMPRIPESVQEMRIRVETRPDDGADVYIEGETKDAEAAVEAAAELKKILASYASNTWIAIATASILDNVEVTSDGRLVKLHRTASPGQIDSLVQTVAAYLNVPLSGPVVVAPASSGASSR